MIGRYMGITFTTSDDRILTFQSFKRSASARTTKHTPISGKPKTEYLGKELEKVTFTIELNALYGVRPRTIENKFMSRIGKVDRLVIGGRKIGKFMLTNVEASYEEMTQAGKVVSESLDITVEEYV